MKLNQSDKNGKVIDKGSYVKFENKVWEVLDWEHRMVWLEPRAGNECPAQWAHDVDIELTDIKQLHLDLGGTDEQYFSARNEAV
jgi:hypothetical protein